MPNPVPCGYCGCTPVVTNVPGGQGLQGATGQAGATGPAGPAGPSAPQPQTYATYGSSATSTYQLAGTSTPPGIQLLNLNPTPPSVILSVPGTYMLFARVRVDAESATLTTQTLTIKLRCVNNTVADIPNTTKIQAFLPITTTSGTVSEITTPVAIYTASAGDNIQVWGSVSAATGAGTLVCVEADIVAVQLN